MTSDTVGCLTPAPLAIDAKHRLAAMGVLRSCRSHGTDETMPGTSGAMLTARIGATRRA